MVTVVGHRDRSACFGVQQLHAAQARRVVVVDDGEIGNDLVQRMMEVLTSMCARLYGWRGTCNRAVTATKHVEPVEAAG